MVRYTMLCLLCMIMTSCGGPGKVVYLEDTEARYIEIRETEGQGVGCTSARVQHRPNWLNEKVYGDLRFLFEELHGNNPRIVVESSNKRSYEVVCQNGDREALNIVARELGCVVTREEREISALTLRVQPGGHRLKPAAEGEKVNPEEVYGGRDEGWPLEGATMDELARFLEIRYRRPVVNLTSLEGRWSIRLAYQTGFSGPLSNAEGVGTLDGTGLDLRWEKVKIPVTVVKDKPQ